MVLGDLHHETNDFGGIILFIPSISGNSGMVDPIALPSLPSGKHRKKLCKVTILLGEINELNRHFQ